MIALKRASEFLRDESGAELAEYALVMTAFTLIGLATIQLMGSTANNRVETDETNYSNAFIAGF